MRRRAPTEMVIAEYFTEEVRRELVDQHGEAFLYEGGLSIRTTLSPQLQTLADRALLDGLIAYDRRHGWRGPAARIELTEGWQSRLVEIDQTEGLDRWQLAVVLEVAADGATVGFADGRTGVLPLAELTWAQSRRRGRARPGDQPSRAGGGAGRRGLGGSAAGRGDRHDGCRGGGRHERRAAPVHAAPTARGRGRGGGDEPAHRARARDQRRLQLQAQRLQPRDPGAAPARLGAQAVHLSCRPGRAA